MVKSCRAVYLVAIASSRWPANLAMRRKAAEGVDMNDNWTEGNVSFEGLKNTQVDCELLPAVASGDRAAAEFTEEVGPGEVLLATFSSEEQDRAWAEMNDPVMGGVSTGSFRVDPVAGVGIFQGQVNIVPFLGAPGFLKATAVHTFPSIERCDAIAITARAGNNYSGYRWSVGWEHAPGNSVFAAGFKANYHPSVGEFSTVSIPLTSFTNFWNDATGDAIVTCEQDSRYCLDKVTKRNIREMAVWAEGVAGCQRLEIKHVKATGCDDDDDEAVA